MQTILVIAILLAASIYLGRLFYQRFFAVETKCDGCAVGKLVEGQKRD